MTKLIPLTKGKAARVDNDDYTWLSQWKWHASRSEHGLWYAERVDYPDGRRQKIKMHRLITNALPSQSVDHIDRDGLNNTRSNLRIATHSQNNANRGMSKNNTSGYRGVSWHKYDRKWIARVQFQGRDIHLGRYIDPVDAARAYDQKVKELFGEFAYLNFPNS